jgi:argininosuccinate synthase
MNRRIVLAYSGDPKTTVAIPSLARTHDAEVVTLTLDIGAGRDLEEIRERAMAAGAVRAHVIDACEEFAHDFVLPSLRAGARRDGDPMAGALARALVRRKLEEVARIEEAFEAVDQFHVAENLWGREGSSYVLSKSADDAPATPALIEIMFEQGVPVCVNGIPMGMTELIESLSVIAGHHGIGRIPLAGLCLEAPAAVVLHAAQAALESAVLCAEAAREKRARAAAYAGLIAEGRWFTREREVLDALNARVQDEVSGSVRIRLFKARLQSCEAFAMDPDRMPQA